MSSKEIPRCSCISSDVSARYFFCSCVGSFNDANVSILGLHAQTTWNQWQHTFIHVSVCVNSYTMWNRPRGHLMNDEKEKRKVAIKGRRASPCTRYTSKYPKCNAHSEVGCGYNCWYLGRSSNDAGRFFRSCKRKCGGKA